MVTIGCSPSKVSFTTLPLRLSMASKAQKVRVGESGKVTLKVKVTLSPCFNTTPAIVVDRNVTAVDSV
jgi:hypothetical protein